MFTKFLSKRLALGFFHLSAERTKNHQVNEIVVCTGSCFDELLSCFRLALGEAGGECCVSLLSGGVGRARAALAELMEALVESPTSHCSP